MYNNEMLDRAKQYAASCLSEYIKIYLNQSFEVCGSDMYIVWFCKTLQNWKAIISTNVLDDKEFSDDVGRFIEVSYNGDTQEIYCDLYKKQLNKCYNLKEI